MKKLLSLLAIPALLLATACEEYDHAIADHDDRLEQLEASFINSVEQQLAAIESSLSKLEATDKELDGYIKSLEATATALQEQLDETNAQVAALEADLEAQLSAATEQLLTELAALKEQTERELAAIQADITALKAKDAALEAQIADLKSYVDQELSKNKDWATATFATLEQYDSLQTEVSAIKASIEVLNTAITDAETRINNKIATDIAAAISALRAEMDAAVAADIAAAVTELTTAYTAAIATAKEEITAAYTAAIAAAIADSEASMKQWVNETLAEGYYDIATIDGKLAALDTKVDSLDEALTEQLAAQQAALNEAKSELTAAYTEAITAAIETNNGVIDTKIAEAVQAALASVDAKLAAINATLANLQSQIDAINSTIATIEQQITNITASIEDLEEVDEALKALIESLQAEAADLQSQLDANSAADAATKQALETEIANLNALIAALQAKDTELEQQIADLKSYVDTEIGATEDWAEATFATLTQYTAMQTELATLTALIETYKQELTDAYTAAIAEAVADMQTNLTALETSMKQWVNETLAQGYYDIATIDGKLAALQATLDALAANGATDQELAAAIAAQQAALNAAKSELTAAYTEAITAAIETNNGVIDAKIANAIATAKAELQSQIDAITTEITAIKSRLDALEDKVDALIARIQSIRFMPEYSDGMVELTSDNAPVTLTFLLSPNEAAQAVATAYESNNSVVTAYLSRTQSRTRAVDAPAAINVTNVAGTADGMLTVEVNTENLPADYWATAENANLFIRISDGNNDVISEMIPAFYTVPINYVWTRGITASTSVEGEGTEASPYLIHSANDLQWMIDQVAQTSTDDLEDVDQLPYYQLTHDLEIDSEEGATWTPIGGETNPFFGYFDGGGHTISGEMVTAADVAYVGFFGVAAHVAVITNLTNAANVTSLAQDLETCFVGGIAGAATGWGDGGYRNTTFIMACHNVGTITNNNTSEKTCVGGIAGLIEGGICVVACGNTGQLVCNQYKGAIAGGCSRSGSYGDYTQYCFVSCIFKNADSFVGTQVSKSHGNYTYDEVISDEEAILDVNSYIYTFNYFNGEDDLGRNISCDWHWELEDGEVVLKAGAPSESWS